jgi:branched-chain amino acid transport system substrate-binding protein
MVFSSCGQRVKFVLSALLCLGASSALPAMANTNGVTSDQIVLHHVGPLKNAVLAASNNESVDGADVYFAQLNARGGVNGRKIVISRHDDGQDAKKTGEIVKSLADAKSGLAFVMPRTSPSTEAMMPLVEAAGIPLIGPQPGTRAIAEPMKRNVFAIRATYGDEVKRAIELQHALGRTKIAFLVATDAFGNDVMKAANEKMSELKVTPVALERVDNRTPDVSAAIKAFAAARPEIIIFVCNAKSAADVIKEHSKLGGFVQFIALSNASNSGFVKDLGPAGRGVMVMQVLPNPQVLDKPLVQQFAAAMKAAGKPASYNAFQGYITAMILAESIKRAGKTPTPASLTTAMEGIEKYDLGGYVVSFGKSNRLGSRLVEPTMISKDGRFI